MPLEEQTKELFEQVRANSARLRSCTGPHEWEDDPESANRGGLFVRKRCKLCGGHVSPVDASIYDVGVAHGRKAQQEGR